MNSKVIFRTVKLKSKSAISSSAQHAFRERETENANAEETINNIYHGAKSTNDLIVALDARIAKLKKPPRSNSVLMLEFMVSASPEFFLLASDEDKKTYFVNALMWFQDKFGDENILLFGIHLDEKTPHATVYVTPVDSNGNLNCRYFTGGKAKLSKLQTSFAKVQEDLGLERGVIGSTAKHQSIKSFYANIKTEEELKDKEDELNEKMIKLKKVEVELIEKEKKFNDIFSKLDKKTQIVVNKQNELDAIEEKLKQKEQMIIDKTIDFKKMEKELSDKVRLNVELKASIDLYNEELTSIDVRAIALESVLKKSGAVKSHLKSNTWLTPMGEINIEKGIYRLSDNKLKKNAIDLTMDLYNCKYNDALLWLKQNFTKAEIINTAKAKTEDKVKRILENDLKTDLIVEQKKIEVEEIIKTKTIVHSRIVKTNIFGEELSM